MPRKHRTLGSVVLDVDGVIWIEGAPAPNAITFLRDLRRDAIPFCLLTNDCSVCKADRQQSLEQAGLDVRASELVTAAEVTADWLKSTAVRSIMYLGAPAALRDVAKGIRVLESGPVDAVVVGDLFADYNRQSLDRAAKALSDGAALVAMQSNDGSHPLRITSMCISAIAPTLISFDASKPDSAYAILYSSLAGVEDVGALSQCDPQLTERRLVTLRSVAHGRRFAKPCITDLVGYVNWRLTGALTMNSISFAETGVGLGVGNCDVLAVVDDIVPRLVAPGEQIGNTITTGAEGLGIEAGIPVCGGCPDTLSSVVGAGLLKASETMLYLGTFGSLLQLDANVDTLLNSPCCLRSPFRWHLSVPGLGPEIETLSRQWLNSEPVAARLSLFDQAAMQVPPGAGGTLFLVPRWKVGMMPVGKYEFVGNRNSGIGDVSTQARAVLEGVAYAALALDLTISTPIKVSGGGARSRIWLDILSSVLNRELEARSMSWEAIGAADIAAKLTWKRMSATRSFYSSSAQSDVDRALIEDNCQRAKELYRGKDWL